MATMQDPSDRERAMRKLDDELNRLQNSFTPQPMTEVEPVWQAWTALREVVKQELEDAMAAVTAAA